MMPLRSGALLLAALLMLVACSSTAAFTATATTAPSPTATVNPLFAAFPAPNIQPVAVSPDGRYIAALATNARSTVAIYTLSGQQVATLTLPNQTLLPFWAADSSRLFVASNAVADAPPVPFMALSLSGAVQTTHMADVALVTRDFQWIAGIDGQNTVTLATYPLGTPRVIAQQAILLGTLGDTFILDHNGAIYAYAAATGATTALGTYQSQGMSTPNADLASPDGTVLGISGDNDFTVATMQGLRVPAAPPDGAIDPFAFPPPLWAGPHTIYLQGMQHVAVYDPLTGTVTPTTLPNVIEAISGAWLYVEPRGSQTPYFFNATTGKRVALDALGDTSNLVCAAVAGARFLCWTPGAAGVVLVDPARGA